jgi:sterol desaturase/sphingolipid hydroxylase (fatty acid hydroxylase superfamily)
MNPPFGLQHFLVDSLRLGLWLAILSVIFIPLEYFFSVNKKKISLQAHLINIGFYFFNSLVPAMLIAGPLSLISLSAQQFMPTLVLAHLAQLPLLVKMLLALVISEIGFYWGHRLSHRLPLLWKFHSVHHGAEHLYFLVNSRAHPVDMIVTRLCGLIPLYVLGLAGPNAGGSTLPLFVIFFGTGWGFFIHANLRWRLGPLEWLIATPAFHHWHHTRTDHIDHNFASMMPFLDRIFGTLYLPRHWPAEYGIQDKNLV